MSRTIGSLPSIRLALAFVLLVAQTAAFTAGGPAAQPPGQPPGQPAGGRAQPADARDALHVKFKEGTSIRLRGNRLVSLGTDDLTALTALLAQHPGTTVERLFSRPEASLDVERGRRTARSGRPQKDLNLWYRLRLRPGADADRLIADLRALDVVESAYREPKPAPPPVTPDFSSRQGYRDAALGGIDALYAATIPGGTGTNVRIIDIEYSWNLAHEDLAGVTRITNGTPTDPFSDNDHGTAVLGEIGGNNNGIGVTGLAPGAWLGVVNASDNGSLDLADAINTAAANLTAGDVILIEQQAEGANGGCDTTSQVGCVAVEWVQAFYDAVAAATADGIIVVEPAGNGSQDLDGTEYGGGSASSFPDGRADSGAIIVGAGAAPGCTNPARGRLDFSTFGSRVNLQGWGECVVTTGYGGDLQGVSMANDAYTSDFGGTSSASPIVASAAAILSSVAQQQGVTMTPQQVRARLVATGSAQGATLTGHIGPLPNLREALKAFVPTAVAGGPYNTQEGTDVQLNAGASSDPQGSALTFAWDFDNDGQFDDATGATPTFTNVGQNDIYVLRVRVTDPHGASDTANTTVRVFNVAPSVVLSPVVSQSENVSITLNGVVSDPGWQDSLSATVIWGDGTSSPATGTVENARPDATLTFSASHVYGDDGAFTVTVCASDGDVSTPTCTSTTATVTNSDPTATIDVSGATIVNGVPTILAKEGVPTAFSARSTDAGSDDLTVTWTWADGTPATVTTYLNAGPLPDPDPSPSVNPRDVTNTTSHVFGAACAYSVGLRSADDDSGLVNRSVNVIVVGNATTRFNAGYWLTNYRPRPTALSESRRQCFLQIVGFMSPVFSEVTSASSVAAAFDVLFAGGNGGSPTQLLDRQLLAAWLNFANGAVSLTTMVDTDGKKGTDALFGDVMAAAEAVRMNPAATADQLLAQKSILERINN